MKKIGIFLIFLITFSLLSINLIKINKVNAEKKVDNKDLKIVKRDDHDLIQAKKYRKNKNDYLSQKQSQHHSVGLIKSAYGEGSGVLVKENKVITATHVISKPNGELCKNFSIKYYPFGENSDILKEQTQPIEIKKVKQLKDSELTVLTLKKPIKNIKPLPIKKQENVEKSPVKAIGYKKDNSKLKQFTSKGNISFIREDFKVKKYNIIFVHIKNDLGMSGGPLLDKNNKIIGITSFKYNKDNYAGYVSTKNVTENDLK